MPQTLKTERLVLRPYRDTDAQPLTALIATPAVQCWLPVVPHPYSEADAAAFIARAKNDPWKLAVTLEDGLIGGIAIAEQLGYWLGEPFWGQGFATEASRALLSTWFDLNDGVLASGHMEGNTPSRNVLRKLGFTDTEKDKTHSNFLGRAVVLQHMSLSARDWRAAA